MNFKEFAQDISARKKKQEAIAANALGQLMRGGQAKIRCSARILESLTNVASAAADAPQAADFRVVLITEGMGNSADKHFYGSEAIESGPAAFEGRPCFLNHPSVSEDKDIPERRVESKCGYFRNAHVADIEGERSLVADLVLDFSEAGYTARAKLRTALRYRQEFPSFDSEYVGLSINANGAWEKRKVSIDGKQVEVKYVTKFTRALSCDIVTDPARGGRVLTALVESAAGAKGKQEGVMKKKLMQLFEAARTALKEAKSETDPEKAKTKLAEADQSMDAFVQEASAMADDDTSETKVADEKKKKSEDDATEAARKKTEADAVSKTGKKEDEDADAIESRKLAIKGLLIEAALDGDAEVVAAVSDLPLKEAKQQIEFLKKFKESTVRKAVKTMGVPAAQFAKLGESERKEVGSANNNKFAGCNR